jgi:hypoxanthine phosphoribosyltransferase
MLPIKSFCLLQNKKKYKQKSLNSPMNKGKHTGVQLELGSEIYRGADSRIYVLPEAMDKLGFEQAQSFEQARIAQIQAYGFPDIVLVPGKGGLSWWLADRPHLLDIASKHKRAFPKFIPYISKAYSGTTIGREVVISGLDHHLHKTIRNGMWVLMIDDVVDTASSFVALQKYFRTNGLDVELDILAPISKIPRCFEEHKGLEEQVITPRHIVYRQQSFRESWIVYPHELSDFGADELDLIVEHKGMELYRLLFSEHSPGVCHKLALELTPTSMLQAAFLLAKEYEQRFGAPNRVIGQYPEKDFDKLGIHNSTPSVPFCEYFRAGPKLAASHKARLSGTLEANAKQLKRIKNAEVIFSLFTRGPFGPWEHQGEELHDYEDNIVVVGNYIDVPKQELQRVFGRNVKTASIFRGSGEEPDIYLLD